MAMEALGRVNVVPIAAGKSVSMKDHTGVMFVCTGNDTFTLKSQPSSGGAKTNLVSITDYYTSSATDGSVKWTDNTQAAAASVTIASGTVVFHALASQLPSAAKYVVVDVAASGLVSAYLYDSEAQRDPKNLAAPNA